MYTSFHVILIMTFEQAVHCTLHNNAESPVIHISVTVNHDNKNVELNVIVADW